MKKIMNVLLVLFSFAGNAFASLPKNCLTQTKGQVRYVAKFKMQLPMLLKLSVIRMNETKPGLVGEIISKNSCEAICHAKSIEWDANRTLKALDLQCESNEIHSLSAPTSVVFAGAGKFPKIRFGTWLTGYQEAMLNVEVDHLSGERHLR